MVQRSSIDLPGIAITRFFSLALLICAFLLEATVFGDIEDGQKLFRKGKYAECIQMAKKALSKYDSDRDEEWPILLSRAQAEIGKYADAQETIRTAIKSNYRSIRLRLEGYYACMRTGLEKEANGFLDEINDLSDSSQNRYRRGPSYRDPLNVITLGRAAILLGADPRLVLDNYLEPAKKVAPKIREVYLAIGNLGLDKGDFELAAKNFEEGLKLFPNDPDFEFGRARAYEESDRDTASEAISTVLDENPNYVPALLFIIDNLVDGEEYAKAREYLNRIEKINPSNPDVGAFRAVLAHLDADPEKEKEAREKALAPWQKNPRVDYLIGKKLSQKYRFKEGEMHQRQALAWDHDYLPAQLQLAQDLLRLGHEEEGWSLAEKAHHSDAYDVQAYNLTTLKDTITAFKTVTNEHFAVRMSPHEAEIYGKRVLALLEEARRTLGEKYGIEVQSPVLVEIFPEQKDFAIRTFGMPGGEGYLGVCFGSVITANSPASQTGSPSNWQAMLWHEFCHVVTLQITHNKMPRWLSEGISVYEELQKKPAWGQVLTPKYREMILGTDLKKVGDLSSAFMNPKKPIDLQFAYFESAMVVQFIVEKYGFASLKNVLSDLGADVSINSALEKRTEAMPDLEKHFREFAQNKARDLGKDFDWHKPKLDATGGAEPELLKSISTNFWVMVSQASRALEDKRWDTCTNIAGTLIEKMPQQRGAGSAYAIMAEATRRTSDTNQEIATLEKWVQIDGEALGASQRLLELSADRNNWSRALEAGNIALSINPLLEQPYGLLAEAYRATGQKDEAIQALRTELLLNAPDAAGAHFEIAQLLSPQDPDAKREVLKALEEAPRFIEAHKLLQNISSAGSDSVEADKKP
jgi:tetratricopeptide (TPR) repeat protein